MKKLFVLIVVALLAMSIGVQASIEDTNWIYTFDASTTNLVAPRGDANQLAVFINCYQYSWVYINDRDWSMGGTQPEQYWLTGGGESDGSRIQVYTANLYEDNVFYIYATAPFTATFKSGSDILAYTTTITDHHTWEYSPDFTGDGADPNAAGFTWNAITAANVSANGHKNSIVAAIHPGDAMYLNGGWYRVEFSSEPVPEPASFVALAMGCTGLLGYRKIRK